MSAARPLRSRPAKAARHKEDSMTELKKKPLFNPEGDPDVRLRRMIGGNTTNLNDFNNMKYAWVSDWYRQAMNNFWIPEEINLSQDVKDYPRLLSAERSAYDKILSFLVFWIPFRQRTCLISAPTLPPTRSISACPFRRFRSVSTHRATAICSTPSVPPWSAMTSSTNGKRTSICCAATPSLGTATTSFRNGRTLPRCCA